MTKGNWDRVEALFFELEGLEPNARGARLAQLKAAEPDLSERLSRLLAASDRSDELLEPLEALLTHTPDFAGIVRTLEAGPATDPHGLIGRTISHYEVVELLGAGGMGVLYRAVDTRLGRSVALKFLPPSWSLDETFKRRFLREARAIATLDHPNVCAIHEIGETADGRMFMAMPFYEGETVGRKVSRGALPLTEALALARQAASGLEAAHAAGLVHRDIKPDNLMVTGDGILKILDFGIAKTGETALTEGGMRLGTPAYMSPEQARGEAVDERADLWSLGAVLYEMLTGRRPFPGSHDRAVLDAIRNAEPEPPGRLRADLPEDIETLVLDLLSRDPEARVLAARSLSGPTDDPEPAVLYAGTRWSGAPWKVAAVAVAVLAVGGTAALLGLRGTDPSSGPRAAAASAEASPRIAVLPFEVGGMAGEETASFADGLHDEMMSLLSRVGLRLTPRESVREYRTSEAGAAEIARELRVGYILRTTIWRAGGQVRINVELIDTGADETRWAESYTDSVTVENIFAIQTDVARRIAAALESELGPPDWQAIGTPSTYDMEAYDHFLRGLGYLRRSRFVRSDLEMAVALLERALELDHEFALARVALANSKISLHYQGADRDGGLLRAAKAHLDSALRAHPDLPVAYHVLGNYHYRRREYAQALRAWQRHEAMEPGEAGLDARVADVYRRQGRWEEAIVHRQRAIDADPLSATSHLNLALSLHFLRRYEEAGASARRSLEFDPASPYAWLYAALAAIESGGPGAGRAVLEETPAEIVDDPGLSLLMIELDAWAGDHRRVLRRTDLLDRVSVVPGQTIPFGLWRARSLRALGDSAAALTELERTATRLEELLAVSPDSATVLGALGMVYATLGRPEDAIAAATRSVELMPVEHDAMSGPVRVEELATVYAWTGHEDEAVELLERLLAIPSPMTRTWLDHPVWRPLRGHPRFEALRESNSG